MGYQDEAVSPCVKYTLFFTNLLFWLTGGACLGVGLYARLLQNDWDSVSGLSTDPAILLIVAGAIVFVIGFCGAVGSLRENVCLLKIFAYTLAFLVVLEIAAGVVAFLYKDEVKKETSKKMKEAITGYHVTNTQTDLDDAIEAVQQRFSCCGADSARDWINLNKYYTCTREYFYTRLTACGVPPSCCKENAKTDSQCGYKVFSFTNMTTKERAEYPRIDAPVRPYFTKACSSAVVEWVENNYILLGSVALGVLVLQIFGICFALNMVDQINFILRKCKI